MPLLDQMSSNFFATLWSLWVN